MKTLLILVLGVALGVGGTFAAVKYCPAVHNKVVGVKAGCTCSPCDCKDCKCENCKCEKCVGKTVCKDCVNCACKDCKCENCKCEKCGGKAKAKCCEHHGQNLDPAKECGTKSK